MSASFIDDTDDKEGNIKQLEGELWDVIQSCYGLLTMIGDAEESNSKHVEKLKGYEEINRIPKVLGWVEI